MKTKLLYIVAAASWLSLLVFLALTWRRNIDLPTDLALLGIRFKFYSVWMLVAVVVAWLGVKELTKHFKQYRDINWTSALLWVIIPGILGARAYHVITDFYLYQSNPVLIFALWNGGLGILGGIIGGAIGWWLYAKQQKLPLMPMLSALAVMMPFAQAIGRLGNYFNRELYGVPTDLPWGTFIELPYRFPGWQRYAYYHPLFAYEAAGNVILGLLLLWVWYRQLRGLPPKSGKFGRTIKIYIVGYFVLRFFLEFIRLDVRVVLWGLTATQLFILGALLWVIIFGAAYQLWYYRKYQTWFTRLDS